MQVENPEGGAGQVLRPDVHRGTVALVTGGGTGIGRAIALDLARTGADVVIAGRRPEPLEKTAAEIEALGARALALTIDIRDDDQVTSMQSEADTITSRAEDYRTTLTARYAQIQAAIAAANSTQSYLKALLAAQSSSSNS